MGLEGTANCGDWLSVLLTQILLEQPNQRKMRYAKHTLHMGGAKMSARFW